MFEALSRVFSVLGFCFSLSCSCQLVLKWIQPSKTRHWLRVAKEAFSKNKSKWLPHVKNKWYGAIPVNHLSFAVIKIQRVNSPEVTHTMVSLLSSQNVLSSSFSLTCFYEWGKNISWLLTWSSVPPFKSLFMKKNITPFQGFNFMATLEIILKFITLNIQTGNVIRDVRENKRNWGKSPLISTYQLVL